MAVIIRCEYSSYWRYYMAISLLKSDIKYGNIYINR